MNTFSCSVSLGIKDRTVLCWAGRSLLITASSVSLDVTACCEDTPKSFSEAALVSAFNTNDTKESLLDVKCKMCGLQNYFTHLLTTANYPR